MDLEQHEETMAKHEAKNGEMSLRNYMYAGFVLPMVNIWARTSGRGESLFAAARYENFSDFIEEKERIPFVLKALKLTSPNGILIPMIKSYCKEQMSGYLCAVNSVNTVEELENFEAVAYEIDRAIDLNKDNLLEKVKSWFPEIYKKYGPDEK